MEFGKEETIGLAAMASIGIVLAYFVPEFVAQNMGWEQEHDELVAWAITKDRWLFFPLVFVYVLSGFFAQVATLTAGVATATMLYMGIKEATIWLVKIVGFLVAGFFYLLVEIATFVLRLFVWPFQTVADYVQHSFISSTACVRQRWAERQELRRLYREEFADQFSSFREFKRYMSDPATEDNQDEPRQQEPPKADPYADSVRLLGLTGNFTRKDLEDRYRKLMSGVHPDVAGPNELAAQINQARDLIKQRKGWK